MMSAPPPRPPVIDRHPPSKPRPVCLLAGICLTQSKFVEELAQQGRIRELILDQYANYVVQRALTVANNEEGLKLVNAIRPHLHSMQVTK